MMDSMRSHMHSSQGASGLPSPTKALGSGQDLSWSPDQLFLAVFSGLPCGDRRAVAALGVLSQGGEMLCKKGV